MTANVIILECKLWLSLPSPFVAAHFILQINSIILDTRKLILPSKRYFYFYSMVTDHCANIQQHFNPLLLCRAIFRGYSELLSCVLSFDPWGVLLMPSYLCRRARDFCSWVIALLVNVFSRQLVFDTVTKLYRSASVCAAEHSHTVCFCSSPLSRCMMSLSLLTAHTPNPSGV